MALRIAAWNIDGLAPNKTEVEVLMTEHKLDVVLISESHCNNKSSINIKGCNTYTTCYPDGTSHGGSAVIIRKSIKHHVLNEYRTEQIQATTVAVEDKCGFFNLSAVYCPPRHKIDSAIFKQYFSTLGGRFIAGGDWNAKHVHWGSRIISPRGRQLKQCLDENNLHSISTGEPTNWPTDPKRKPDLIDFYIAKGLSKHYLKPEPCYDTSSSHTPVLLTVSTTVISYSKPETLCNKYTDWDGFRDYLQAHLELQVSLKTPEEIDNATKHITMLIQNACWLNTPQNKVKKIVNNLPLDIKLKVLDKRRLRRVWHASRLDSDKAALNKAIKELKDLLDEAENVTLQSKLENLTATKATDYSLWRMTKSLNQPQEPKFPLKTADGWARTSKSKARVFAEHLTNVFKPNETNNEEADRVVEDTLKQDLQLSLPPKPVSVLELRKTIKSLQNNKAPGFDLITKEILDQLPRKALVYLTTLFNGILRVQYYPGLWKVSTITMIHKAGKPTDCVTSYRPISLLVLCRKCSKKSCYTEYLLFLPKPQLFQTINSASGKNTQQ